MVFSWHPIWIPVVLGTTINKLLLKHLPKQNNRQINLQLIQVISEQIRVCGKFVADYCYECQRFKLPLRRLPQILHVFDRVVHCNRTIQPI